MAQHRAQLIHRLLFIALILGSIGCSQSIDEPKPSIINTEVLVIGGGASGVSAALQAARLGSVVTIVEETPWLGGMLTAAGVSATDGNHRLPSGIWGEFRGHLRDHYGGAEAVETGWVSNTLFEPHIGNEVWNKMVDAEPNIRRYHEYRLLTVIKANNRIAEAWFLGTEQDTLKINPQIVIEATELGDVLALAQVPYWLGQDDKSITQEAMAPDAAQNIIQDLTFALILKDFGPGEDRTIPEPDGYDPEEFNCACKELCDDPEVNVVDCQQMLEYGRLPNDKFMINWPIHGNDYYVNSVEMSWEERQQAFAAAKLQSLRFLYHIQTKAGFTNLGIAEDEFPTEDLFPFIPYHRESRRVKGVDLLTVNHLKDPYDYDLYQQAIAVGDYPLDHHHDKKPNPPSNEFPAIPSFSIPYGSLIPQDIDGLIVAEKSISVSHLANGSTRLQPCVILIGQAAGTAAALSVQSQVEPRALKVKKVQQTLLDAGCWLMPFLDVTPEDSIFFQPVQRIGLRGWLKGTGVPYKWANQTWFYPDSFMTYNAVYGPVVMKPPKLNSNAPFNHVMIGPFIRFVLLAKGTEISEINEPIKQAINLGWLDLWHPDSLNHQQTLTRKEAAYILDKAFPFEED